MMVWDCMGWNEVGMLIEVERRIDVKQYVGIIGQHIPRSMGEGQFFRKTITSNIPPNWPKLSSKIMDFRLWIGLPNLLTSTQ